MRNGSNDWGVPFSHIAWFERLVNTHDNVASFTRTNDILFEVKRIEQNDSLRILCLREYTMGKTMVQRAQEEFEHLDIIYIGGGWNACTTEAKDYCKGANIGIYVSEEMTGALWRNDYWNYFKRDRDGNPIRFIRDE